MPFHYKIDIDAGVVVSSAIGSLNSQEVEDLRAELSVDASFDPEFDHLIDLSAVTELQVEAADIKSLAETRVFNQDSKTALVGDRDLLYGMSRVFQAWRDNDTYTEVFRSMDEARQWLAAD